MNTKSIALASLVALAALSGSAFAQSTLPEAGNVPGFKAESTVRSTQTRAEVQAQVAQHRPAAGDQNGLTVQTAQSDKTRSEVRAELRQALNSGYRVPAGSQSY